MVNIKPSVKSNNCMGPPKTKLFYSTTVYKPQISCLHIQCTLMWLCFVALQISDASGSMKVTAVAPSSPFKQAMLSPEECYILDNGVDRNIFVWKGTEKCSYLEDVAEKFLK